MLRRACFIFVLVILSSECEARGPQWDIYDLLDALGLKSFSGLLESTGYMYKLSDNASGPFTVFAPSEEAFSNLPPSVVKKLQHDGNWDLLHDLTSFHITRGNFSYFNWTNNMIIPTSLEGSSLRLNIYNNKSGEPSVMSACGATLIKGDQVATNGIVQIIDRVLYRYPGDSLPNYIQQNSKLRTLAMLMQIDGYQDKLNEIFRNHTVSNTFYTNGLQILDGGFVINNSGAKISIKVDEDIYLNGVKISEEDIPLSNGVLHIVNRMLFPLHNQE
ncbi:periostin-like isoform X2 [Ostrea edulis]|uniref:periostin-like isoform X2 n=1 Tax=Ostrea edulis TaxID=37623 RepID=UPI0024AF3F64|nr:periostin-like isoform X2 [Ostrea edulis]